jgi:hypothetical protein
MMHDDAVGACSASDLLNLFIQLRGFRPDMSDWSEDRFTDRLSVLYRLQQFRALFRASEIDCDPSEFARGNFIKADDPRYEAAIDRMNSELEQMIASNNKCRPDQLRQGLEILLDDRERLERVLSFSSGVLTASGLYFYAYKTIEELNQSIRSRAAIVDDVLAALISPEGKTFAVEFLAREYRYPDVDLFEIDSEWW